MRKNHKWGPLSPPSYVCENNRVYEEITLLIIGYMKNLTPGCAFTGMEWISWEQTLLFWSVPVYQNIIRNLLKLCIMWPSWSPYCWAVDLIFVPNLLSAVLCSQVALLSSLEQLQGELHLHCLASRGTMVPVMVIVGGVDDDPEDTIEDETKPKGLYNSFRRKYFNSFMTI